MTNGNFYYQNPNTGKWERVGKIKSIEFTSGDDVIDERPINVFRPIDDMMFSFKMPVVIDTTYREVEDGQKRLDEILDVY